MIDRTALTGAFPDQRLCVAVFALCTVVAVVLALFGLRSWLKGE